MRLWINGQKEEFSEKILTLSDLLKAKGLSEKRGIAVAVNNQVIPRTAWASTRLKDDDQIIIITAAQGG